MRFALAALLVVPLLLTTACGDSNPAPKGWCSLARERQAAFATMHALDPDALAAYKDVEARAPAKVRADLRTVRTGMVRFANGDSEYFRRPGNYEGLFAAMARVNNYLRDTCRATIPDKS
jgi:hypothetical protein